MSPPGSLADVLGAAVRIGTERIGEVVGIFVEESGVQAIGLEVAGAGGIRRFLPWVAARFGVGAVWVESPLLLVDDGGSYERRGAVPIRERGALEGLQALADGTIERPPLALGGPALRQGAD